MPHLRAGRRAVLRAATALSSATLAALLGSTALHAQTEPAVPATPTLLPPIPVESLPPDAEGFLPLSGAVVAGDELRSARLGVADTTVLLQSQPGVSVYSAGGRSALPVIHGLASDRVRTVIDGMTFTAACPNHMNPPLSYTDPATIGQIEVIPALVPVSRGGDSIGGTISVDSPPPAFAEPGQDLRVFGDISAFYNSNNHAISGAANATVATGAFSLSYSGAGTRADNYRAGGDQNEVLSTLYAVQSHTVTAAARNDGNLFTLQAGVQHIPYQGYPNQRMDMTDNLSVFVNGRYQGQFNWGALDARLYWQRVTHEMNFLDDKGGTPTGGMPMDTEATDLGYSIRADIPLSVRDTLRVGNEFHRFHIDDWWPPVAGAMMMSPDTFWNINNGERNRFGLFAEWEAQWTPEWTTLIGARTDIVWMDTGPVQAYSSLDRLGMGMMAMANPDAAAARAFNAADHARTDVNFDLTALVRYQPSRTLAFEAGYARQTRSPNLYERYAWGTGSMSSAMIGWFGDANSYVGNPDLDPEVAHTVAATVAIHDSAEHRRWEVSATPYVTYVEDFIDVDRVATLANGFVRLRFANHDALLYGFDLTGRAELYDSPEVGQFSFSASAGWVHGERLDIDDSLYHMMPVHATLGLNHQLGGWSNSATLRLVAGKEDPQGVRNEPDTAGYALLDLRTSYQWDNVRVTAGIDNVFDTLYYPPLGGTDYAALRSTYGRTPPADVLAGPVPGMGRTFLVGVTVSF